MRHDPYHSPWRRVIAGLAVVALAAIIVVGVATLGHRDASPPTSDPTTTSTPQATGVVDRPKPDASLNNAVFAFVEAYNLPASAHRNELLKKLTTPAGYGMVYRNPDGQSAAEKAAGDITITSVRDSSSIQIEPFEDDSSAASVYSEVTVRIIRDGKILSTIRLPAQTTSWVKQADGWKLAFLQT